MPTESQRVRTLERYHEHRRVWDRNDALRALYRLWYGKIAARLPDPSLGPFVEIGSGPGFARDFIPTLQLSDIVRAPWHDHHIAADRLPFADASVGALVLFDVLHHLASPAAFFGEAERVLASGGKVVMCEPYMSPLSYPVHLLLHDEPVILGVDPLGADAFGAAARRRGHHDQDDRDSRDDKDPFDSNQAIPTLLFDRRAGRAAFARRFPALAVGGVERLAGPAYPASGGFSRPPLLPLSWWRALFAFERLWPPWAFRLVGFRMLVDVEKRPPP